MGKDKQADREADGAAPVTLDRRLDLTVAGRLRTRFLALRGRPVQVDASEVALLGGLCLQVLLAAAATWRSDGRAFRIAPRSAAFDAALSSFAFPLSALEGDH
ncbi:STAS domain-containing protein [Frigidibacter sp. RF13]|uniref:STAS domain-containing protein n=1 Tax=Frigidibacter sp. RF13 TaxID=2997340 RepID=UPI00226F8F95|nr:STAS domain-containing protein [Frigidibacter sp. RF13]MCY1125367.1 STAS domain-containing protein [Frigidibacter sp. RF13]